MSSVASDPGHAVRPDGTLKDASEINWSFDADKSAPFPSDNVSGVRRTTRVPCLSQRAVEAAKAVASNSPAAPASARPDAKRKVPTATVPRRHVTRKVVINLDASDSDEGATTEPNTDPASDDYKAIKAMADADNGALTDPASDDYEAIKAIADADNEAMTSTSQRKCGTADILLIFYCQKDYVHLDTKKILDGHWCRLCRKNSSIKRTSCFLTGSASSLRMHITRHHAQLYHKRCNTVGIEPNHRALFRTPADSGDGLSQTSLDGIVTHEPKVPVFTRTGLIDHIVEVVVCEDEVSEIMC
ncbi:hypothetical protein EDB85DRAFT_1889441 [Lactarius pseudohatsudake]|nr:hypothetical protein EDB85DRAFT_1889441 [Lactarius pseudohatsudake]